MNERLMEEPCPQPGCEEGVVEEVDALGEVLAYRLCTLCLGRGYLPPQSENEDVF